MQEPMCPAKSSLSARQGPAWEAPALVCVLALALISSLWGLEGGPPLSDHEAMVAQSAREVRLHGHWLLPTFNESPSIRKPPLQYWLVAIASWLVDPPGQQPPVSATAARFTSAMGAFLMVVFVYILGKGMYGVRAGLVGALILTSCASFQFFSHNAQTDLLCATLMTGAMALFWLGIRRPRFRNRYLPGFYALFGLSMLSKAPLPLALIGLTLFVYWFGTIPVSATFSGSDRASGVSWDRELIGRMWRQVRRLSRLWFIPGVVLLLMLSFWWHVCVLIRVENAWSLWRTEYLDRYAGLLSDNPKPFWYYLPLLFVLVVPFLLSLPEAFLAPFMNVYRKHRAGLLFVLTWVVVETVFLSTSPFKRPHYLLPVLPGLCLLLAPVIDELFFGIVQASRDQIRVAILAILGVLIVGGPIALYLLAQVNPQVFWLAWRGAFIPGIGIVLCCALFYYGQRLASLVTLSLMSVLLFGWIWSALGRSEFQKDILHLADRLKNYPMGPNDGVTWGIGRTDARLSFYSGMNIPQLFCPMDLAGRRRGRLEVPEDLVAEGIRMIRERLEGGRREYLIFESDKLDRMSKIRIEDVGKVRYREVFRVSKNAEDPDDAWVVVTNPWNTGPDAQPPTSTATAPSK